MSAPRDFDRFLAGWLAEEGPQEVPDRLLETLLADARRSAPPRRWALPVRGRSLSREGIGLALPATGPAWRTWIVLALLAALVAVTALVAGSLRRDPLRAVADGTIVFEAAGDLWTVDPVAGRATPLTSTSDTDEGGPAWSRDGRSLAMWVTQRGIARIDLAVLGPRLEVGRSLRAPAGLVLPPHRRIAGWSPDGRTIVAPVRGTMTDGAVTRAGVELVAWFDTSTGEGRLLDLGRPAWSFGFSPDGAWLGIASGSELFVLPASAIRAPDPAAQLRRLASIETTGDDINSDPSGAWWRDDLPPVFSADSRAVLYLVNGAAGEGDLATTGGGGLRRSGPLRTDDRPRDTDIRRVSIDAGPAADLVGGSDNDLAPTVSVAGALAYLRSDARTTSAAMDQGGDLWVSPAAGGEPVQVATGVAAGSLWSPTGAWLGALTVDRASLMLLDPSGRHSPRSIPLPQGAASFTWQPVVESGT